MGKEKNVFNVLDLTGIEGTSHKNENDLKSSVTDPNQLDVEKLNNFYSAVSVANLQNSVEFLSDTIKKYQMGLRDDFDFILINGNHVCSIELRNLLEDKINIPVIFSLDEMNDWYNHEVGGTIETARSIKEIIKSQLPPNNSTSDLIKNSKNEGFILYDSYKAIRQTIPNNSFTQRNVLYKSTTGSLYKIVCNDSDQFAYDISLFVWSNMESKFALILKDTFTLSSKSIDSEEKFKQAKEDSIKQFITIAKNLEGAVQ